MYSGDQLDPKHVHEEFSISDKTYEELVEMLPQYSRDETVAHLEGARFKPEVLVNFADLAHSLGPDVYIQPDSHSIRAKRGLTRGELEDAVVNRIVSDRSTTNYKEREAERQRTEIVKAKAEARREAGLEPTPTEEDKDKVAKALADVKRAGAEIYPEKEKD